MSSSAHQLIARRNLSGYTPHRWCAVCGKATSKAAHVSCEDDSCPNLCHTGCLGDNPVYRCAETGLLREQANIQDPVTFVDREADPSSQPLPPPLRGDQEQAAERSHWEDLEKTDLISLVEKLTEEVSRTNIILRSLQQDRDLIIEYREVFASALRLADRLVASKQREAKVASCTQGVSALPETIDRHWEEVCQGSECWRDWWNSGRPKQLRHAPELAIPPTQPGNRTPPEATPSSTSVAEPPSPPSSTPVSLPTSSGLNTSTSQTHSTATSTQNQTHTNTLPAVPPTLASYHQDSNPILPTM